MITWEQLIQYDLHLEEIRLKAAEVRDPGSEPGFCANAVWRGNVNQFNPESFYRGIGGFKGQIDRRVGWRCHAEEEIMKTQEAHDLACRIVYAELPDCRHCWCL